MEEAEIEIAVSTESFVTYNHLGPIFMVGVPVILKLQMCN